MSDHRNIADACDHYWTFREIDGETWNVCIRCGFGEMWAGGMLCKSTDDAESERLSALEPEGARRG